MWKKKGKGEEVWANKVGLVTLLDIEWKELNNESKSVHNVATLALGSRPRQGVARKAESQKEGSPGAKANALEGCGPRGGSPGVITYSRESKEVRGSVRE
jgi:hypothetical protein